MEIRLVLLIVTLLLNVLPSLAQLSTAPEKRLALVVGNETYAQGEAASTAVNDAQDMAVALKKLGFEVMLHTNLDSQVMQKAITDFSARLKRYRAGLFYYSGHGKELDGIHYLIPVDANPSVANKDTSHLVETKRIVANMKTAELPANIILLETSRAIPEGTALGRGGAMSALDEPAMNFIISYATAPGKSTITDGKRNGYYTAALLKYVQTPNQPIEQVLRMVRRDVMIHTNNRQIPWDLSSFTKDFFLVQK